MVCFFCVGARRHKAAICDPFQQGELEGFLPVGCGAEAVFNFSLDKTFVPYGSGSGSGSGDDDGDDDGGDGEDSLKPVATSSRPRTKSTSLSVPTRNLPSSSTKTATTSHVRTTRAVTTRPITASRVTASRVTASRVTASWVTASPVTASRGPAVYTRLAPRLPPRVTVSPEERQASFQQLLRLHLNTFNHRLSMLESNTLDMKDSIRTVIEQQGQLGAQLEKLVSMRIAAPERQEKVGELEKSYGDMETRLSRLEGRLEILIDGFTALAQEMNKMKRSRHSSRSAQERRGTLFLDTRNDTPLGRTPTPSPTSKQVFVVVKVTGRPMTRVATLPQSIPTPHVPVRRVPTASPDQKRRPTTTTPTTISSPTTTKPKRLTVRKVVTRTQAIKKPTAKSKSTQGGSRNSSKQNTSARPRPDKKGSPVKTTTTTRTTQSPPDINTVKVTTKFQVEPPAHKPKPAAKQPPKKPPVAKHPKWDSKKGASGSQANAGKNKSFRSDSPHTKRPQKVVEKARPEPKPKTGKHETKVEPKQKQTSHQVRSVPSKVAVTTTKKPPKTTTSKALTKRTTRRKPKSAPVKKKQQQQHHVLDLLQLLQGDKRSRKGKIFQDGSLHVVLGRLAIPIRIIPDD